MGTRSRIIIVSVSFPYKFYEVVSWSIFLVGRKVMKRKVINWTKIKTTRDTTTNLLYFDQHILIGFKNKIMHCPVNLEIFIGRFACNSIKWDFLGFSGEFHTVFTRVATSLKFSSFELFEFCIIELRVEPSLGSILRLELRALIELL